MAIHKQLLPALEELVPHMCHEHLRLHFTPLQHTREQGQCDWLNRLDHLLLQEQADFFIPAAFGPCAYGYL
jgi:hypothetical protein